MFSLSFEICQMFDGNFNLFDHRWFYPGRPISAKLLFVTAKLREDIWQGSSGKKRLFSF